MTAKLTGALDVLTGFAFHTFKKVFWSVLLLASMAAAFMSIFILFIAAALHR